MGYSGFMRNGDICVFCGTSTDELHFDLFSDRARQTGITTPADVHATCLTRDLNRVAEAIDVLRREKLAEPA